MRAALSAVEQNSVSLRVLQTSRRATAPDEHAGVRQKATRRALAGGVVGQGHGRRREKERLSSTGHPVSLLVFPSISVSLYWVSPMSATGRRPASGCFLGFPPGLSEEGGSAALGLADAFAFAFGQLGEQVAQAVDGAVLAV